MVDELRVRRLLRQVTDTVDFLDAEAEAGAEPAVRGQRRWLDSIKYNFIAAIECCVDLGQHVCAVQGWGPPATNAEVFRLLAAHGVLDHETGGRMARASGFRNVLVHDELVVANLARTSELRDFVRCD